MVAGLIIGTIVIVAVLLFVAWIGHELQSAMDGPDEFSCVPGDGCDGNCENCAKEDSDV